ncbi:hypothetical protein GCM10022253_24210 [Sphingomonas endophytica]|uniref:DNA-binding CsgD family transcriptional regulator n=1 Tax=Sphingomonas endophytica TaxID=869719 RepID=A0ABR6N2P9_9SPHN|nr:DNA-binding CsgD family transcriptional regulator [Sphingomonas endophytica]
MSIEDLSKRERECLERVAKLQDSKTIARELGLSSKTVDGHIERAIRKVGARDRRDAARQLLDTLREPFPEGSFPVAHPASGSEMAPVDRVREPKADFVAGPAVSSTGDEGIRRTSQTSNLATIALVVGSALGFAMLMLTMSALTREVEKLARFILSLRRP